jgi:anaerobic selenocysteine-containing dehydrogenase
VIQLIGGLRTDVNAVINDFSPGIYLTFGKFDPASSIDDAFHAKFIMFTHCNPIYTQMAGYHYTAESRYNGGEVVVVAPDVSPSHVHADYFVPIRPGTDAALGLAMSQVIIDEKLYEAPFVKEQTDLPLLVRLDNRRFLRQSDLEEGGRSTSSTYWGCHRGGWQPRRWTAPSAMPTRRWRAATRRCSATDAGWTWCPCSSC